MMFRFLVYSQNIRSSFYLSTNDPDGYHSPQVKLWCDCPFWPDDGMCRLRDCSVCECPENEFPEPFKKPSLHGLAKDDLICQEGKPEAAVDRTLDAKAFKGWAEVDNPWTNDDETDNGDSCITLSSHVLRILPFVSIGKSLDVD